VIRDLAASDPKTLVRAAALQSLASLRDHANRSLFDVALKSQSYSVQAAALAGIIMLNPEEAFPIAKGLEKGSKGELTKAVLAAYTYGGGNAELSFFSESFDKAGLQDKVEMVNPYLSILARVGDAGMVNKRITDFKNIGVENRKYGIDRYMLDLFESFMQVKQEMVKRADAAQKKELEKQITHISAAITELKKKDS